MGVTRPSVSSLQVTELNLDNCRATQIEGLTDEYTSLEFLSMINVGLTRFAFTNLKAVSIANRLHQIKQEDFIS